MSKLLRYVAGLVLLLSAAVVMAQPLPQGRAPAPAKPGVQATPYGAAPAAAAPTPAAAAPRPSPAPMPPGHPQLGANPSAGLDFKPTPDRSAPSPLVPKYSAEVHVVDADNNPLPGVTVRLGILRQTVASGEDRDSRELKSDAQGIARFTDLPGHDSSFSYRPSVTRGDGQFATAPFTLDENHGQQVILHVYDVSSDLSQQQLGMFCFMFVETRDDVFAFEVMFRVYNIGRTAWVPKNVRIGLPEGWKAFRAQEGMSDARVEADDDGLSLLGTFSPGQHEVAFTFNVTNSQRETRSFTLELPPRVGQLQLVAGAPRGMTLEAVGFDPARPIPSRNGQRSLGTVKRLQPGEEPLRQLTFTLGGIPVRGNGAWFALGIAGLLMVAGIAAGATTKRNHRSQRAPEELTEAQDLILDELVRLAQAHRRGEIGPRTFQRARLSLLNAIARLQAQVAELEASAGQGSSKPS